VRALVQRLGRETGEGHEDVFLPVAMAPAGCPEAMADELRRCVKELGFRTSHLVPYCGTRNLDDPSFYPTYQAAEELGVPLLWPSQQQRRADRPVRQLFQDTRHGTPTNCAAALVALVLGGVFEKFRAEGRVLRVQRRVDSLLDAPHGRRLEWAKDFPQISGMLRMAPSEYIRRNCYVTCEADEPDLRRPVARSAKITYSLASDYPHFDSEFPHTVSNIRARGDLTERQKAKILGENAARLLRL